MKRIFTLVFLLAALGVAAQKKNKKGKDQPAPTTDQTAKPVETPVQKDTTKAPAQGMNPFIGHNLQKRNLALKWNDAAAAKNALLDLVVETGNDSLAYLLGVAYYESGEYPSSVLVAKDLLTTDPKNLNYLQLSAAGFEALGLRDKAIPDYESIYMLTGNTAVLYKMSNLQYETKKYAECKANVDILLTKTDLDSLKVSVNLPDNKTKEFPIKVAILNLKGLLLAQSADKPGARKAFQEALAISPDFPQAKENLAKLK